MSDRVQALRDALEAERAAAYAQLDPADFEECIKATDAALAALAAQQQMVRAIEVSDRIDHTGHVGIDGSPCGVGVTWKSRMGRDLAAALDGDS